MTQPMSEGNGSTGEVVLNFSPPIDAAGAPSKVDGAKLLDEVLIFVKRFVRVSEAQSAITTVWIAHTHAIIAARETAYLNIHSPEKQSGKTRLLEVLELLVLKPWLTGRVTAAVLVRKIDQVRPTLLLDESDAAFHGEKEYAEALRGILNTGHREDGKASCCVGQGANITFKDFRTYCAKALAGIGRNLPDTVSDRSIPIALKRKAPGEQVQRFRRRDVKPEADELKMRLSDWLSPMTSQLREARPQLPEGLSDRRQDGLEPLLSIADAAGGEWPERIRSAAVEIFTSQAADDDSLGVQLLGDIRAIFETKDGKDQEKISSEDLAQKLKEIEAAPWGDWDHGKGLSKSKLARLLHKFEISSRKVRFEGRDGTLWGYLRESFEDAWVRYLTPSCPYGGLQNGTTEQPAPVLIETHFSETEQNPSVPFSKSASNPHECCIVPDVPFLNPGKASGREREGLKGRKKSWTEGPVCPGCWGTWPTTESLKSHLPNCKPFDLGAMTLAQSRLARGQTVSPELEARYRAYTALGIGLLPGGGRAL
jgi:hypothetical protein